MADYNEAMHTPRRLRPKTVLLCLLVVGKYSTPTPPPRASGPMASVVVQAFSPRAPVHTVSAVVGAFACRTPTVTIPPRCHLRMKRSALCPRGVFTTYIYPCSICCFASEVSDGKHTVLHNNRRHTYPLWFPILQCRCVRYYVTCV